MTQIKISTTVNDGKITGEIISQGNVEIPEVSIVTIRLSDVSLQDVAAIIVAEKVIKNADSFPVEFSIAYDPKLIKRGRRYAVSVRIVQGGK